MTVITKNISQFIEDQFPEFYRSGINIDDSERAVLIDFMEAYYEFLEANRTEHLLASRDMFEYRDIDETLDSFIVYFKTKYLNEFPIISATDERFAIKHIIDLYRTKGTEKAVKLLIRLMFNKDSDVYYPAQDVLRASTSTWFLPRYIEITRSSRNSSFIGKTITGSKSGTTAFVQSLITKRVNGKVFDVLYVTNIAGDNFETGEYVTDDGLYVNAPEIIGSLSSIDLDTTEGGYAVGDILDVISDDGVLGKARVTSVLDINNQVDFRLLNGGFGYSVSEAEVLVSTAVLFLDNSALNFEVFDTIEQPLFKLTVDANTSTFDLGETVNVLDETSNTVADGIVVGSTANSVTIERTSGTFTNTQELTLNSNSVYLDGETIIEESSVELELISLTGAFTVGERLLQVDQDGDGVYSNVAYGRIVSANTSTDTYVLDRAWGTFIAGKTVRGVTSETEAEISTISTLSNGVSGTVQSSNANVITVSSVETFTANSQIRGESTKIIEIIDSTVFSGPQTISGANTASANISIIEDISASGEVIGQNENVVAITGNTNPFIFTSAANNNFYVGNTAYTFTRIGQGSGASYEVGTLNPDTTEVVTFNDDLIGGTNVVGVNYLDIYIDGSFSGVGQVSTANVISGGTGYSNSSVVTVSGGGYEGGEPLITAQLSVQVDGNGSITDVNIDDGGQGYFEAPTISVADGAGASISVDIESGYGFPAMPLGSLTNGTIAEILNDQTKTIGEIATLKSINPGVGYDTNVFTRVIERDVYAYRKYDNLLNITGLVGVFDVGEIVSANTGATGRVETASTSQLKIKRLSFNTPFEVGDEITGGRTTATATISSISDITGEDPMGFNASISSVVVLNSGVIATVEVVDSGFGYIDSGSITLRNSSGNTAATGTSSVERQGTGTGFWKTTESHLNEQYLHDNDFYQEYSYQVIAPVSLNYYRDVVRDIIHVSGMKIFGKVENESYVATDYIMSSNNVTIA